MCGIIGATDIASISGYDEYVCSTSGYTTTDPCTWTGVTCTDSAVTWIDITGNALTGTIPSELGQLTSLTNMDLSYNSLTGTIPSELDQLTALTYMNLYSNSLNGTIPSELGQLTALTSMILNNNSLTGTCV